MLFALGRAWKSSTLKTFEGFQLGIFLEDFLRLVSRPREFSRGPQGAGFRGSGYLEDFRRAGRAPDSGTFWLKYKGNPSKKPGPEGRPRVRKSSKYPESRNPAPGGPLENFHEDFHENSLGLVAGIEDFHNIRKVFKPC